MKKTLSCTVALFTALVIFFSTAACSDKKDNSPVSKSDQPAIVEMNIEEMPESLIDFLSRFTDWCYSEKGGFSFDCENDYSCLMQCVMQEPSCVGWMNYPVKQPEGVDYNKKHDPKKWAKLSGYYLVYDQESVKWIITNIFNISEEKIPEMVKRGEKEKIFYASKGKYYRPMGGLGDPFTQYGLVSVKREGKRYYVDYNVYSVDYEMDMSESKQYSGSFTAELELKNIDGKDYWSLYKVTETTKNKEE